MRAPLAQLVPVFSLGGLAGREPKGIGTVIEPLLKEWAKPADRAEGGAAARPDNLCFGLSGLPWNEEQVLERYELLYEAGLVYEARRDRPHLHRGSRAALFRARREPIGARRAHDFDHRRILATAMGRLRGKLKYRPVVFELMPPAFTLFELQRTVEAISGVRLHKQNFRRLLARTGLVEPTGPSDRQTAAGPRSNSASAAKSCASAPLPACGFPSRAQRGDDERTTTRVPHVDVYSHSRSWPWMPETCLREAGASLRRRQASSGMTAERMGKRVTPN